VSRIHVGAPVDVKVDALGRTFQGQVARFAEKLNLDTRTMDTEVDVANRQLELVPGMYAYASITTDQAHNVVVAPVQAIDRKDGKASVLVVDGDGTIAFRPVTVGLESPEQVEIRSGLRAGELVVVGGRAQLKAGTAVTPKLVDRAPAEGAR
jgi:RND family efflux transporter MFP subunit